MSYHAFLLADQKRYRLEHIMETCNEADFIEWVALLQYHDKATRPEK